MATLVINGIQMPPPDTNGIDLATEPVWSKNTGRVASGVMTGDIIIWIETLSIKWTRLTAEQFKKVRAACKSAAFFPVTYLDPDTDSYVTRTFYSGTPKATLEDSGANARCYTGVSVELIQKGE